MATEDANKTCKIINNSGNDIMIALPVGADETSGPNAVPAFNKDLEILKTSGGGSIIKNGSTDSVLLERTFKPDTNKDDQIDDYDLLISDSTWIYPLVSRSVEPQASNGSTSFEPQTITTDNKQGMSQAVDFYQTIFAYPSSKLTRDFATMLKGVKQIALLKADGSSGSMKAVADTISNTVNTFFQATDSYKKVTLDAFVAVDSYYKNFPFVWAQYKDDTSYFLYGCDGSTATFEGVLSLKKSGPVDISKPNGGYTCQLLPAVDPKDTGKIDVDVTRAISLTYDDGLFSADANTSNTKLGLQGMFNLKRLFTGNEIDNSILTIMIGNINGMKCIGFDKPQQTSKDAMLVSATTSGSDIEKYWDSLIHPKNQYQVMISLLTLAGIILLIPSVAGAIYSIYRLVKFKAQMNEDMDGNTVEEKWQHSEDSFQSDDELRFGNMFGPGGEKEWIEVDFNRREEFDAMARNDLRANKLMEAYQLQEKSLAKAMEFSSSMNARENAMAQSALDDVRAAADKLRDAAPAELKDVLPELYKKFDSINTNIADLIKTAEINFTREAVEFIDEQVGLANKIFDGIQDSIKNEEQENANDDPVAGDHILPGDDF
jgi:hypothetical protein